MGDHIGCSCLCVIPKVQLVAEWDAGAARKNPGPSPSHHQLWYDRDFLFFSVGLVQNVYLHGGGRLPAGIQPQCCAETINWLHFCHGSAWGIGELPADTLTLVFCASRMQQRRARGRIRAETQHPRWPLNSAYGAGCPAAANPCSSFPPSLLFPPFCDSLSLRCLVLITSVVESKHTCPAGEAACLPATIESHSPLLGWHRGLLGSIWKAGIETHTFPSSGANELPLVHPLVSSGAFSLLHRLLVQERRPEC